MKTTGLFLAFLLFLPILAHAAKPSPECTKVWTAVTHLGSPPGGDRGHSSDMFRLQVDAPDAFARSVLALKLGTVCTASAEEYPAIVALEAKAKEFCPGAIPPPKRADPDAPGADPVAAEECVKAMGAYRGAAAEALTRGRKLEEIDDEHILVFSLMGEWEIAKAKGEKTFSSVRVSHVATRWLALKPESFPAIKLLTIGNFVHWVNTRGTKKEAAARKEFETVLEKARAARPQDDELMGFYVEQARIMGKYDQMEKRIEEVSPNAPGPYFRLSHLAWAALLQNQPEKAKPHLAAILQATPDDEWAMCLSKQPPDSRSLASDETLFAQEGQQGLGLDFAYNIGEFSAGMAGELPLLPRSHFPHVLTECMEKSRNTRF